MNDILVVFGAHFKQSREYLSYYEECKKRYKRVIDIMGPDSLMGLDKYDILFINGWWCHKDCQGIMLYLSQALWRYDNKNLIGDKEFLPPYLLNRYGKPSLFLYRSYDKVERFEILDL